MKIVIFMVNILEDLEHLLGRNLIVAILMYFLPVVVGVLIAQKEIPILNQKLVTIMKLDIRL